VPHPLICCLAAKILVLVLDPGVGVAPILRTGAKDSLDSIQNRPKLLTGVASILRAANRGRRRGRFGCERAAELRSLFYCLGDQARFSNSFFGLGPTGSRAAGKLRKEPNR
jgi:hypothetical protein